METLQITWFITIGILLVGYAILDGFDLGAGFWHLFTKDKKERKSILKAIGPFWDGNEVWLLTAGGAIFAAFPPVYASVFSGFYLAMMLVLLGLILRAVSIEFHSKLGDNDKWDQFWDVCFSLGSLLPALLFGVAIGNIVRGVELDPVGNYTGGFLALLNPYALLVGVTGLMMFATHGALFLAMKTNGGLMNKARRWASISWWFYLGLFIISAGCSLYSYQKAYPHLTVVATIIALVMLVLIKVFNGKRTDQGDTKAFFASSLSIASILAATGSTLFPYIVPASNDMELSLTLYNSSSSQLTLSVMLILALIGMPLVIGYSIYVYKTFSGKVS